jgi:hypothetical protein
MHIHIEDAVPLPHSFELPTTPKFKYNRLSRLKGAQARGNVLKGGKRGTWWVGPRVNLIMGVKSLNYIQRKWI